MNTIQLNKRNMKMDNKTMNQKVISGRLVVALMFLASCGLHLASAVAQAAFSEKSAGTRAAQFLKLPVGARYIGMGEAATAVADDANAMFYNVAGLARMEKKNAEYMYSGFFIKNKAEGETNPGLHWIAYAMPISEKIGSAGIGFQYYNAGDINETDISANKVGTFSPYDLAVNLSYARMLMEIPLGLNLKIINSKIKESASTIGVDLGAQYTKLMEGKMMLGFAVQNLGGNLKYETEGSKLPILIKLGSAIKPMENWVAALDIVFPEDSSPTFGLGTDYKHMIGEEMSLSGRVGYNSRGRKVDGFNGITLGLGFGFNIINFDLAWMPMGELGQTVKFSLGAKF